MTPELLESAALVLLLVLAISVHEWAHAAMTTYLGDSTAKDLGRLTLNPVSHTDPVWTLAIPLLGLHLGGFFVAAGRPVPYNPSRWQPMLWGRRLVRRWGEFLVAIAGPGSNLVQALVAALALGGVMASQTMDVSEVLSSMRQLNPDQPMAVVVWSLDRFIFINCLLTVFNLMPIAPLDGAKVLAPFLPRSLADRLEHMGMWGFLLLLLIVFRLPEVINTPIDLLRSTCLQIAIALGSS